MKGCAGNTRDGLLPNGRRRTLTAEPVHGIPSVVRLQPAGGDGSSERVAGRGSWARCRRRAGNEGVQRLEPVCAGATVVRRSSVPGHSLCTTSSRRSPHSVLSATRARAREGCSRSPPATGRATRRRSTGAAPSPRARATAPPPAAGERDVVPAFTLPATRVIAGEPVISRLGSRRPGCGGVRRAPVPR